MSLTFGFVGIKPYVELTQNHRPKGLYGSYEIQSLKYNVNVQNSKCIEADKNYE